MPYIEGGAIEQDRIVLKTINSSHLTGGKDISFAYVHDDELHALGMVNTFERQGHLDLFDHQGRTRIGSDYFEIVGDLTTPDREEVLRRNIAFVFGKVAARASRTPDHDHPTLF